MVSFLFWLLKHFSEHVIDNMVIDYCKKFAVRVFDSLAGKLLEALTIPLNIGHVVKRIFAAPFEIERAVKRIVAVSAFVCAMGAIVLIAYGLKKSLVA